MAEALQYGLKDNGVLQGDIVKYLRNVRDLVNSIQAEAIGDSLSSLPGLAIGSTATAVSNVIFSYKVNGVSYIETANAVGTAPGNDVIPQSTYGAVALDIGADGTIDVIEAGDNATGYASAALAIAGIAAVAADHVRMGTVTVTKSDGAFTFGTTNLDAANVTTVYTDGASGASSIVTTALTLAAG
jgi:hypothetical protein